MTENDMTNSDLNFAAFLFLLACCAFPIIIYTGYCIRFYRRQFGIVYLPHFNVEIQSKDKTIEHEEITYQTRDGLTISAWYVPYIPDVPPGPAGVILCCHGNAGNISQRIDSFKIFRELGFSTFIFDYRGYGKSQGIPSENGTYLDADGAWEYLVKEMKVKPENIVVFGRSLGGGVASYLAEKYRPRALIIESSFTSIPDMARAIYPWLPVKILLRIKYNTRERLKYIHCPVLIVHSPEDRIIPFILGQILYEAANPPKRFLRIKGDHLYGFFQSRTAYINGLREFINELPQSQP